MFFSRQIRNMRRLKKIKTWQVSWCSFHTLVFGFMVHLGGLVFNFWFGVV